MATSIELNLTSLDLRKHSTHAKSRTQFLSLCTTCWSATTWTSSRSVLEVTRERRLQRTRGRSCSRTLKRRGGASSLSTCGTRMACLLKSLSNGCRMVRRRAHSVAFALQFYSIGTASTSTSCIVAPGAMLRYVSFRIRPCTVVS